MANGEDLGEVTVKRGMFQGDILSPFTLILKKVNACCKWGKKKYKLNQSEE